MSYLTVPRVSFSGRFQSDVSTVNNDVRHYENAAFKPRFQEPQTPSEMNGWWNPRGTGAFRLIDVTVKQAVSGPGEDGAGDPATGLYLNAQASRTAAKMVDMDPQFQMGSALWGLRVSLTDGTTEYMRGDYLAAPFRDLFFGRVQGVGGSGGASAKYTSVLENVEWTEAANASPVLSALKSASTANSNRLSVNVMTFGYITNSQSGEFTYGNITGSIGIWQKDTPRKFAMGRRFAPVLTQNSPFSNSLNIGFFDGGVSGDAVSLDLSNALPLANISGQVTDLDAMHLALLKTPDTESGNTITPAATEGDQITAGDWIDLGEVPYRDANWLMGTAGLSDHAITPEAQPLISERALALVQPGTGGAATVMIREAYGGLFLRADDMELRVDTIQNQQIGETVTLYAARYGAAAAGQPVAYALNPPETGQGGSGRTAPPAPQAPIPVIGTPPDKVHFSAAGQTAANGTANFPVTFDPPGNPRGYIDGQIYKINYRLTLQGISKMPTLDQIVSHVRDAYAVPDNPDWDTDIKPILQQYGNLYPIMSKGLFTFDDPEVVKQHARILIFAFSRPLADPNHMPVTRDLSEAKRQVIVKWLGTFLNTDEAEEVMMAAANPETGTALDVPPDPVPIGKPYSSAEVSDSLLEETDGKTNAMRDILAAQRQS